MRSAQPRTGKVFNCKRCGKTFYAPPSRAKEIERKGYGFCGPVCFYASREAPRRVCPVCGKLVRRPNVYCSPECYRAKRKEAGRR